MTTLWTPERVRRELPNVKLRVGTRHTVTGRTSGRKNRFATVSVTNTGTLHSESRIFGDWKVTWDAIARALNTDSPICVE